MSHSPSRLVDPSMRTVPRSFPLALAVWLAIATGFLELAFRVGMRYWSGRPLMAGLDLVWMAPASTLIWFGPLGVVMHLAARRWPERVKPEIVIAVVSFVLFVSLTWLIPGMHKKAATVLALGLAVQTGRLSANRFDTIDGWIRRTVKWPVAALLLALVGVIGGRWALERWRFASLPVVSAPSEGGVPNVLLLILDTVRAQNLSLYGYAKPTTPNLEKWAAEGIRFDRTFATSSWTLPSHAAMFTGRHAHELSIVKGKRVMWAAPLDDEYPTLAEAFTRAGYATGGFAANPSYITWEHRLNRGFIHFEDFIVTIHSFVTGSMIGRIVADNQRVREFLGRRGLNRKSAAELNVHVMEWLDKLDDRPFFVMGNYYDAHTPLYVPAPFDSIFGDSGLVPGKRPYHVSSYDGAIAYLDQQVNLLLSELRGRGLLDKTLVIITSDHGEQWGEHGKIFHGNSMYRQLLHVPLVMRFPGRIPKGEVVRTPVSLIDLPATILSMAGLENDGRYPGKSLAGQFNGSNTAVYPPILSATSRVPPNSHISLIASGFHYIRMHDGREEIYDLDNDPLDSLNLVATPRGQAALPEIRGILEAMIASPAAANGNR
ncbi:MAG: sulfatase [Gemmatimonadaceae bacterium]